jgi:hypothetical protein
MSALAIVCIVLYFASLSVVFVISVLAIHWPRMSDGEREGTVLIVWNIAAVANSMAAICGIYCLVDFLLR